MRCLALQHVLRTAADMIFLTLAPTCPDLLIIVMDFKGDFYWDDPQEGRRSQAFIRTKHIDLIGQVTYASSPIEARKIKQYEPCYDLFRPQEFVSS